MTNSPTSTKPTDVPQLSAEEEAELVARINANPNLHPVTNSPTSTEQAKVADWLNAFKADPFSTGADKAERCIGIVLASLPPKPVDGEVAELVRKLRKKRAVLHDADRLHSTLELVNPDGPEAAAMLLAFSRNTEPMVTDAMIEAGYAALRRELFGYYVPDIGVQRSAVTAIYLAMVSAGEKGTDDAA